MNKVALVGRLTKDPEVRYTANNQTPVAKFTIAVNRMFKQEGQPDADFIPIVVWGKPAENCGKYIGKGRLVAVSGRIQTRSWDDQEGKRHFATEVTADEVHFLDKASDVSKGSGSGVTKESGDFYPAEEEDDLPF
ncbi:MAG: single stranded DNA-binding protein [Clostridia bacterium]|jgi:single-strand DNA-binding protein|nr:single stranded DNA-binding protein [Clostridia bacterium]